MRESQNIGTIPSPVLLENFQQALATCKKIHYQPGEAMALTYIGEVYQRDKRREEALKYFLQALSIWQSVRDSEGATHDANPVTYQIGIAYRGLEAATLAGVGATYNELGQHRESLKYLERALKMPLVNPLQEGILLRNIGLAFYGLKQYQESLKRLEQALLVFKHYQASLKDLEFMEIVPVGQGTGQIRGLEAQTLNEIGLVFLGLGRNRESLQRLEQSLTIAKEMRNRDLEATAICNIGLAEHGLGRHQEALKRFQEARAIFRDIKNRAGEAAALNGIGMACNGLSRYQEALRQHQEALAISRDIGNRAEEANALYGIGTASNGLSRYQEALKHHQEARAIFRDLGNRAEEATALNGIGLAYQGLSRYQEALGAYHQALPVLQGVADRMGEANALNNIGMAYQGLSRYLEALKQYQETLTILRDIGNRAGEATTLNNIGMAYTSLSRYEEALKQYQQALAILKDLGDRNLEATTLNNIGMAYQGLSRYEEALTRHHESRTIFRDVGNLMGESTALNNIGMACQRLSRYEEALKQYRQALAILKDVGDRNMEATTLNNIGMAYQGLSRYEEALKQHQQALATLQEIGNRTGECAALDNIGTAYQGLSRYEEALKQYQQALAISTQIGTRDAQVSVLHNLGFVYHHLGRDEEALKQFEQALLISKEIGNRHLEAAASNGIGGAYSGLGRHQEALKQFQQALGISKDIGDRIGEATALNNVGFAYSELSQPEEALKHFEQALAIVTDIGGRVGEATTLNNISMMHFKLGRTEDASRYNALALETQRAIGYRDLEATIVVNAGLIREKEKRYPDAVDLLWRGASLREEIRGELLTPDFRMTYFTSRARVYQKLSGLLAQLADDGESAPPFTLGAAGNDYASAAFHCAERAKARTLTELLARNRLDSRRIGLPGETADEEELLLEQQQAALLSLREAKGDLSQQRAFYDQVTARLNEFIARLREHADPAIRRYASLRYPHPVRANEIPLAADEVLLEYSVLPDESLLWVVQKDRPVKVIHIPIGATALREEIAWLRPRLESEFSVNQLQGRLERLYGLFLRRPLSEIPADRKLVIVPDDVLTILPFEVLGYKVGAKWRYVGEERAINYYPSATVLSVVRSTPLPGAVDRRSLVAFGDPSFGSLQEQFPPLPATRTEVLAIGRLFGLPADSPNLKLGPAASERSLKKLNADGDLHSFRYVHLATHGVQGTEKMERREPALVLAPDEPQGEDGLLTMSEVFGLRLEADLVVLSACQTGLGERLAGEGIVGLMRAFLYAGTPSIVVSLWNVGDESTAELMRYLYTNLIETKRNKADALREARLALMKSHPHPLFWAPFILVGER